MAHGVVEIEDDLRLRPAPGHADDIVDLHFPAGAHAEIAMDAGVEIDRHGRVADILGRRLAPRQPPGFEAGIGNPLAEARCGVVGVFRLVGKQQFQHHAPGARRPVARAVHGHARRGVPQAGRRQRALALDLDHAGAAIAVGAVARLRRIAKMRQHGAEARGRLPDGFPGQRQHLAAV